MYNKIYKDGEYINRFILSDCFIINASTKFITHGWMDTGNEDWLIETKNLILIKENVNLIIVDWQAFNDYPQAAANTQIVGVEIALLIEFLISKSLMRISDFHLIGHSLGAHCSGYAGKRLNGTIGRITGIELK